ncbi:MAG: universal stress protein, partial [Campylobacterota bacterium]|nr:universal stress protein [Campylobacterota bacterium]
MKKIKRIIVGLDIFSESNNVLKRALMVAKRNKAELFLIHAVQTPWFSVPSYFGSKEISVDIEGITKKIEKKIKALNKEYKVPYTILVREGDADDILRYEAKLIKADMIIIGANTKSKKKFLGTTAEKVAHQSHLPVLIVKNSV